MGKIKRRMFYISPEIWNSLIKKGFNISKLVRDYLTEIDARNLKPIDLFSPNKTVMEFIESKIKNGSLKLRKNMRSE